MSFRIVESASAPSNGNEVLLVRDNWNDWFTWVTQFYVIVVTQENQRIDIGHVKIARAGMTPQSPITLALLPVAFPRLNAPWFSIGQTENYYEQLNELGDEYRDWYLNAIRDIARTPALLDEYANEEVLHRSLLRDIDTDRVRNRFHRLATGNAALTNFEFRFTFPQDLRTTDTPPQLSFEVTPAANPPTNVHVVIGRNGVGKTRCFDYLSRAFLGLPARDGGSVGQIGPLGPLIPFARKGHGFAGLVTVSFSPFDEYGPLVSSTSSLERRYAYVGLIQESAEQVSPTSDDDDGLATLTIKGRPELAREFLSGIAACRGTARRRRWLRAVELLEADPLFLDANAKAVIDDTAEGWEGRTRRWFRRLSSGHSVVLMTITRLVELVEEKSLVLIDEPEGHLHPPLLSAFVRALSELLIDRNGVAIVATHSPVVLQEVPRSCAWMLNRTGLATRVDRPELETFGENIGILTREVFGLEVVQTGFHRLISEAVRSGNYDQVIAQFGGRLGGEARSLARALSMVPPPAPDTEVTGA
ncbi:AAA family ATPase [Ralstonia solanacearum]|uniref:Putative EA59 gene protein, phage lambda n=1 Tax=Ralstonia solanacearum CFBP2957 TaxID=859656 RepID=D8P612_RALSL|nr:AAA family ATPase [Ralstonia solanacearum]CBJ54348.1 putative EA59 gene protein, phage lambda [Ralstonia solanacearum CFBP2957]